LADFRAKPVRAHAARSHHNVGVVVPSVAAPIGKVGRLVPFVKSITC